MTTNNHPNWRKKLRPDASTHNHDPDFIRGLISDTGMTQSAIANACGISLRSLQDYLSKSHPSLMPYSVQFCEVQGESVFVFL